MNEVKVGIVEDQKLVVDGLVVLINSRPDLVLQHTASSVEGFLDNDGDGPDVVLLDIGLPGGMTGLQGIRPIKSKYPNAEIVMLTTFDDSDRIFKALCAGASAYLTKRTPFPKIADAILTVHRGGSYMSPAIARKVVNYFAPEKKHESQLTPRQAQIVDALVEGLSYKLVADKLMISTETVRDHIKKIYKKLEINSRAELISMRVKGELD